MEYEISLGVLRFLARRFESWFTKPRIIIFKQKYGNRYFITNAREEAAAVFYHMLKERVEDGYWYDLQKDVGEVQGNLRLMSHMVAAKIVNLQFHTDVTKLKSEVERMEMLLAKHDDDPFIAGVLAFQFLYHQSETGSEYEIFSVETPETV